MKRFRYICISGEDDQELVLGGIGTYLGLLTRYCAREYPDSEIHWITKSPNSESWNVRDQNGVYRYYISPNDSQVLGLKKGGIEPLNTFAQRIAFSSLATNKALSIVRQDMGERTIVETGDWEGHGSELFKILSLPRVLRVARLHTPLASCIKQNKLVVGAPELEQLMREHETLTNADLLSSSTKYVKEMVLADVFGSKKIRIPIMTIPNPVDIDIFRPDRFDRDKGILFVNSILKERFLNQNTFNIVVIGSVEYRKGADLAIKAFAKLVGKMPTARLCFVGRTTEEGERENANKKLSPKHLLRGLPYSVRRRIRFTGYVDHRELPRIIAAGDIFPVFSLGDNFPGVVAEIALSAKPIISLRRGGIKEMLSTRGGKFVAVDLGQDPEYGVNIFPKEILRLSQDHSKLDDVGKSLRKTVLRKYEPQQITRKLFRCYLERLDKKMSAGIGRS